MEPALTLPFNILDHVGSLKELSETVNASESEIFAIFKKSIQDQISLIDKEHQGIKFVHIADPSVSEFLDKEIKQLSELEKKIEQTSRAVAAWQKITIDQDNKTGLDFDKIQKDLKLQTQVLQQLTVTDRCMLNAIAANSELKDKFKQISTQEQEFILNAVKYAIEKLKLYPDENTIYHLLVSAFIYKDEFKNAGIILGVYTAEYLSKFVCLAGLGKTDIAMDAFDCCKKLEGSKASWLHVLLSKVPAAIDECENLIAVTKKIIAQYGGDAFEKFGYSPSSGIEAFNRSPALFAKILQLKFTDVWGMKFDNENLVDIALQLPEAYLPTVSLMSGLTRGFGSVNPEQRQNLTPFFLWMKEQLQTKQKTAEECGDLLTRVTGLLIFNPKIAESLFDLPQEKCFLWEECLKDVINFSDITSDEIKNKLESRGFDADKLFEKHYPWKKASNLLMGHEQILKHPDIQKGYKKWLAWSIGMSKISSPAEIDNLLPLEQLELLDPDYRRVVTKLISLAEKNPQMLAPAIEFANILPQRVEDFILEVNKHKEPALAAKKFIEIAKAAPKIIPLILNQMSTPLQQASFELFKKLSLSEFENLILRYPDAPNSFVFMRESSTVEEDFAKPEMAEKLKAILSLETQLNIKLFLKFPSLNIINDMPLPFLQELQHNENFARDFATLMHRMESVNFGVWNSSAKLYRFYAHSAEGCRQFLHWRINYPFVIAGFNLPFKNKDENSIPEPTSFQKEINQLVARKTASSTIEQILTIAEHDLPLAEKLAKMATLEKPDVFENLLALSLKGEYASLQELISRREKDPADPFNKMLWDLLAKSVDHEGLIYSLLKVDQQNHVVLLQTILEEASKGISPFNKNLVVLLARGKDAFVSKVENMLTNPSAYPPFLHIRRLIEEGRLIEAEHAWKQSVEGSLSISQTEKQQEIDIEKYLQAKLSQVKESSPKEIANCIAECLLQPNGKVNLSLISALKTSKTLKAACKNDLIRQHIDFVFSALERNPLLADRISFLPTPSARLNQKLVCQVLGLPKDEPIHTFHLRQILLSSLFCPQRQSQIGSCFATSITIEYQSYSQGLSQTLEDNIDILYENKLTRIVKDAEIEYPAFVEELLASPEFQNDHLLNRAREYTLAAMSSGSSNLITENIKNFNADILGDINIWNEICKKLFLVKYKAVFIPFKKSPAPPHDLGVWCLADKKTHALIDTPEKYQKMLEDVYQNAEKELVAKFADKPDSEKKIREVVVKATTQINTLDFLTNFEINSSTQLYQINPITEYKTATKLPWLHYGLRRKFEEKLKAFIPTKAIILKHSEVILLVAKMLF